MPSLRHKGALALIFALALGLRLALVAATEGLDGPPDVIAMPDSADYEQSAWELAQRGGYSLGGEATTLRPPGTSFVLAGVYALFGRSYVAARVWICALSAASVALAGAFAWRAFGPLVGLLAAALLCFDPNHAYAALHFMSETPFIFFVALGMFLSLVALERRPSSRLAGVGAGLAYGMATLCRPQLVLAVPLALGAASLAARRSGWGPLRSVALQVAIMVVTVIPWAARNAEIIGEPKLATIGGVTFWGAHNDQLLEEGLAGSWIPVHDFAPDAWSAASDRERDAIAWREGSRWVRENSAKMPMLVLHKIRRLYSPFYGTDNELLRLALAVSWSIAIPFVLAGLLISSVRTSTASTILLVHVAALTAMSVIFYGDTRFRVCGSVAFAVWAAVGLGSLVRRFSPSHAART